MNSLINLPPGRVAVSIMFFINGLLIGAWAPMIPTFKQRLALSDTELGLVILALGIGAAITMPVAGIFVTKYGSRGPIIYLSLICSFGLTILSMVPNFYLAIGVMALFGASWTGMDIAMNANSIDVEKNAQTAIMSSCHGFWSIGGLVSALIGGATLTAFGETGHSIFWQIVFLLCAFFAYGRLFTPAAVTTDEEKPSIKFPRSLPLLLLGFVALFSVMPEGVILDWGALFLAQERNAPTAMTGYGFAATATSMAIMRFSGDPIRLRIGSIRMLQISVIIGITGFSIIVLSNTPMIAIFGFFIAGLGLANLFPIAISAAGNLPGIPSGIAASFVASVGYTGILAAPPLFGLVAEYWDYQTIFTIIPFCLVIVLFLLSPIKHADSDASVKANDDK